MAVATKLKDVAYGRLLARTRPKVIRTESENLQTIRELEKLDSLKRPLTPEEKEVADLLTLLVERFEESRYPLGHAGPAEALKVLMESRDLRQRDLIPVFGSSSVTSDVINGKRSISKAHARKLAAFFHVPVSIFI